MSNLLPCPACGETADYGPKRPDLEGGAWFYIQCINEDCPTFLHEHGIRVQVHNEDGEAAKQAAIDAWNAMPRAIEWSSEPPKVAGLYGCMARCRYPNFFNVTQQMVDEAGWDECLWFGPIPMPK